MVCRSCGAQLWHEVAVAWRPERNRERRCATLVVEKLSLAVLLWYSQSGLCYFCIQDGVCATSVVFLCYFGSFASLTISRNHILITSIQCRLYQQNSIG